MGSKSRPSCGGKTQPSGWQWTKKARHPCGDGPSRVRAVLKNTGPLGPLPPSTAVRGARSQGCEPGVSSSRCTRCRRRPLWCRESRDGGVKCQGRSRSSLLRTHYPSVGQMSTRGTDALSMPVTGPEGSSRHRSSGRTRERTAVRSWAVPRQRCAASRCAPPIVAAVSLGWRRSAGCWSPFRSSRSAPGLTGGSSLPERGRRRHGHGTVSSGLPSSHRRCGPRRPVRIRRLELGGDPFDRLPRRPV